MHKDPRVTAPIAKNRVLAVGQFVVDVLVKPVNRHPPADVADMVERIQLNTGGCTLNAARVLHKLGLPVRLSGLVGDDRLGEFLLTELARTGMDSSGLTKKPGAATSSSIVLISPSGERSFYHCPGATAETTLANIRDEDLEWSDIVHLAGTCELNSLDITTLLKKAKQLGKVVSLDVDYDPQGRWGERVSPWLRHLDYFLPSRKEAAAISGRSDVDEILDYFAESGVKTTVVKMGKEGCAAKSRDGRTVTHPAFAVNVVDATGAGDAFVGGFLAGVVEGHPLEECLRMACAAGALTVTALGAGAGLADRAQFDAFLQEHTR